MSLLAAVSYDPAGFVSKATSSLLAMTALDTTNLRTPSFTVPANGTVFVRVRGAITGGATFPQTLLGVLQSGTVKGRAAPRLCKASAATSAIPTCEAAFLVTGLTPAASIQFDAAYGVEFVVASTNIRYGGADDANVTNAFGAFSLEVWDTTALVAGVHYDPSTVGNASIASLGPMTALDTTNLRLTFTAPASGNVMVRMRGVAHGTTASSGGQLLFGVLESGAIKCRQRTEVTWNNTGTAPLATDHLVQQSRMVVTGLTPSSSYTWDAAYGVEGNAASGNLSWGGPNNTTQDDAYGGFAYEIWDAGGSPSNPSTISIGQVI